MIKSMNRATVIIILAVFLAISVGYALFSDTITIEGTATAQGTTDVLKTSCITNVTPDMLYDFGFEDDSKDGTTVAEMYKDHGYKDVSCNVTNNETVTYSVGFDYPGATKWYAVKMKNEGNISIVFDTNNIDKMGYSAASNTIKKYDTNDNLIETIYNRDLVDWLDRAFIRLGGAFMVEDSNGNFYSNDNEGIYNFVVEGSKIKLEPGESLYLLMVSSWPNVEEFMESGVKYVATNSFTVDWEQYTN